MVLLNAVVGVACVRDEGLLKPGEPSLTVLHMGRQSAGEGSAAGTAAKYNEKCET